MGTLTRHVFYLSYMNTTQQQTSGKQSCDLTNSTGKAVCFKPLKFPQQAPEKALIYLITRSSLSWGSFEKERSIDPSAGTDQRLGRIPELEGRKRHGSCVQELSATMVLLG